MQIDINCDMGETYYEETSGNDEAVFRYITSSSIACGFHGGDPLTIENTIKMAIHHGVRIGAHPSYPGREGFGRSYVKLQPDMLRSLVKYQLSAVKGLTESLEGRLHYVKPHGALYNQLLRDEEEAKLMIDAILEFDPQLRLMCLAGSHVEDIARSAGIGFIAEAFADRRYQSAIQLLPRSAKGAVIADADEAASQALSIVANHEVQSVEGHSIPIRAQSLCVHGDNPSAVSILKSIHKAFRKEGILIKSMPQ